MPIRLLWHHTCRQKAQCSTRVSRLLQRLAASSKSKCSIYLGLSSWQQLSRAQNLEPTFDWIMTPYDDIGRIHKRAFLVSGCKLWLLPPLTVSPKISNGVLFGLCLVSACARYFIRIRLQKKFSIDDGILLFGIGCLIAAIAVLFTFVDKLYLAEAIESGTPFIELPPDFMEQAYDQHKLSIIVLILTWCSIVSVKFSYLFLFKKLIDRIPRMISYWWCVAAFTAVISAYGASVYVVACPYIYSARSGKYFPVQKISSFE